MSDVREDLLFFGRLSQKQGLIINLDGNLSVRLEDGIWISPAGSDKGHLSLGDLAHIDQEGRALNDQQASSEVRLHLILYTWKKEIGAVLHSHPLYATAMTLEGGELELGLLSEARAHIDPLAYVPDLEPGSPELASAFQGVLTEETKGVLLRGHGLVTWGTNLEEAYRRTLSIERLAHTQWIHRGPR